MSEILPGVYEHKTMGPMTWLAVNTDFFLPSADWMDGYLGKFKRVICYPSKHLGLLLELYK